MAKETNEVMEELTVIEKIDDTTDVVETYYDEPTTSGGGFVKTLLAIGGIAAVGTAAYLVKTKEKRKYKKMMKYAELLKAEGWDVVDPEYVCYAEDLEEEAIEDEEVTEESKPEEETENK